MGPDGGHGERTAAAVSLLTPECPPKRSGNYPSGPKSVSEGPLLKWATGHPGPIPLKSSATQFTLSSMEPTMIKINEYIPKGGWTKYRRRQELKERFKAAAVGILLVATYAVCGYIERGC